MPSLQEMASLFFKIIKKPTNNNQYLKQKRGTSRRDNGTALSLFFQQNFTSTKYNAKINHIYFNLWKI